MISGVVNQGLKDHIQAVKKGKEDFINNLTNIEGKIQELNKKIEALNTKETKEYATCEDLNNIVNEIKESFEFLVQTPREITDLKNTVNELKARLEMLEVDGKTEVLEPVKRIPKLLINATKAKK